MNEKPLVALVALLIAVHAACQAYGWLLDTLNRVVSAIH
jgi:hypothetical protein